MDPENFRLALIHVNAYVVPGSRVLLCNSALLIHLVNMLIVVGDGPDSFLLVILTLLPALFFLEMCLECSTTFNFL